MKVEREAISTSQVLEREKELRAGLESGDLLPRWRVIGARSTAARRSARKANGQP